MSRPFAFFYPGSLWGKRLLKLSLLSSIGVNLFINDIQNSMYKTGEEFIAVSMRLSEPSEQMANVIEQDMIPIVEYIENDYWIQVALDLLGVEVPSTGYLEGCVKTSRDFKEVLTTYGPLYKEFSLILGIINFLFWIPISLAGLWILFDLFKGKQWKFVSVALVVLALFNIYSYNWLSSNFFYYLNELQPYLTDNIIID